MLHSQVVEKLGEARESNILRILMPMLTRVSQKMAEIRQNSIKIM
jgi:hypothetical protein